jgi:hypothetical protein
LLKHVSAARVGAQQRDDSILFSAFHILVMLMPQASIQQADHQVSLLLL